MMATGIIFDDKYHTEEDWGLKLVSLYLPMPAPKVQLVEIPGGDGTIDLTEINGRPAYSDRDGVQLAFDLVGGSYESWFQKYSEFARAIHGRKVKMVLGDEPDHYYMVRLYLDGQKTNPAVGQIILSGTAEPFKYDLLASNERWTWDNFSFDTGIIRTLIDVNITDTEKKVKVLGGGLDNPPIFHVSRSENLRLKFGGRTYPLKTGRNRFPSVRVGGQDTTLVFSGTGKMSIEYRGRYL